MVIAVEPNMNRAVRVLWENGMSGWYRYNELVHLPSMLRRQGWWL